MQKMISFAAIFKNQLI